MAGILLIAAEYIVLLSIIEHVKSRYRFPGSGRSVCSRSRQMLKVLENHDVKGPPGKVRRAWLKT